MRKLSYLLAALALILSGVKPAQAVIVNTLPYNLTNGSLADATQVMGNFNQLYNNVNSNAAHNGANTDITSIAGLTTPLANTYGGTVLYTGGTSGGSGNAQTIATLVPSNFTLTDGNIVTLTAGFSNSGATTLNPNSIGATAVDVAGPAGLTACVGGEIIAGNKYTLMVVGSALQLLNPTPLSLTPVSSFTGDSVVLSNSASTGAVTATLATHSANTFFAGPTSGGATTPTFRAIGQSDLPASTVYTHTTSAPTGTTSTAKVMMGLAGAITPTASGNVLLVFSGLFENSTNSTVNFQLYYGTGGAPANGAALTGTALNSSTTVSANTLGPFESTHALITGLTPGVTYWLDLALGSPGASGTSSVQNATLSAVEIK